MQWLTLAATFFILWWLVLFAVLPFSLKTQDESDEVVLGTVRSAPRGAHIRRAMVRTTVVTALLFLAGYGLIAWLDLGFADIPRIVPEFR